MDSLRAKLDRKKKPEQGIELQPVPPSAQVKPLLTPSGSAAPMVVIKPQRGPPVTPKLLAAAIIVFLSTLCSLIAFASPYWTKSFDATRNEFLNAGLWESCYYKYRHPRDYYAKEYIGCYWIFSWTMYRLDDWLRPPWFQAVQAFATLSFIAIMVSCILMIAYYLCLKVRSAYQTLMSTAIVTLVSAVFMGIAVIIFGVRGDDRDWMPRPEFNYFSWSFGLAVVASIFAFVSGFILLFEALALRRNTDEEKTNFPKAPRPN